MQEEIVINYSLTFIIDGGQSWHGTDKTTLTEMVLLCLFVFFICVREEGEGV